MAKVLVKRTRNGGTMTEAMFWGRIRASLRRMWMYWKPRKMALEHARRAYTGTKKNQKWEYRCAECRLWYPVKEVETHHKVEAGSLRCSEDIAGFIERLFVEDISQLKILCKNCHKLEHKKQ